MKTTDCFVSMTWFSSCHLRTTGNQQTLAFSFSPYHLHTTGTQQTLFFLSLPPPHYRYSADSFLSLPTTSTLQVLSRLFSFSPYHLHTTGTQQTLFFLSLPPPHYRYSADSFLSLPTALKAQWKDIHIQSRKSEDGALLPCLSGNRDVNLPLFGRIPLLFF